MQRTPIISSSANLAKSVMKAARSSLSKASRTRYPVIVRLIAQVATRFGVVVTQKAAAQAIPVIGAVGGAAVNYAFIDHFQSVARGHFTVRRLEQKHGKDIVFAAYERFVVILKDTTMLRDDSNDGPGRPRTPRNVLASRLRPVPQNR